MTMLMLMLMAGAGPWRLLRGAGDKNGSNGTHAPSSFAPVMRGSRSGAHGPASIGCKSCACLASNLVS